jgi:hypothetical protein
VNLHKACNNFIAHKVRVFLPYSWFDTNKNKSEGIGDINEK